MNSYYNRYRYYKIKLIGTTTGIHIQCGINMNNTYECV